jgi:large subunit ribosomal protein L25
MSDFKLQAVARTAKPEGQSYIPAELYGPGATNEHLKVEAKEFAKLLSAANKATLIDLVYGDKTIPVLLREIQREPMKNAPIHIDLLQVDPNRSVVVEADVEPVGKSFAISNLGAALVKNLRSLKIECLPAAITPTVKADISKLKKVDDVIRVDDIVFAEGVKVKNSPRDVVFSLAASRKARSEAGANVEGAPAAATPAAAKAPAKKEEKKGKK